MLRFPQLFLFQAADCEFGCNHPALADPKGAVPMLIHGGEAEGEGLT